MCLFAVAAPITASRVTGSFLSAAENTLIPASLQKFGMTAQEAVSAFGRITGMATPLIFFPSALLTALSITLLPAISEAAAIGNKERVGAVTNKALKFTTLIGIGAAGIFLVLPDELGQVIYKEDIGSILFLLGIMCPLWYINITVSGILNGLGKQTFLFMTGLAGSLVNIACVYFVVPKFGVNAFIAGWAISLVLGCALSFWQIGKSAEIKFQITDWFIKPAIAAAGTSMSVEILSKKVLFPFFGDVLGLIMSLALIAALYVVFICLLGCADVSNFKNLLSSIKLKKKATL
jgi:stage V sporulation protein B